MKLVKTGRLYIGCLSLLAPTFVFAQTPITTNESPESHAKTQQDSSFWGSFTDQVKQTWDADNYELYVPLNTWHNRAMYDKEKTDRYNERPWGAGFGVYRYDENDNWHSLYAMAFKDSHNKIEPIIGYGFEWMWIPGDRDGWRFGAGYTASITARDDYSYIPIPLVLPLVSIEYNRLSIQTTYIPGTYNNGNVLFTWMRWKF